MSSPYVGNSLQIGGVKVAEPESCLQPKYALDSGSLVQRSTLRHHFQALTAMARCNTRSKFGCRPREHGCWPTTWTRRQWRLRSDTKAPVNLIVNTAAYLANLPTAISEACVRRGQRSPNWLPRRSQRKPGISRVPAATLHWARAELPGVCATINEFLQDE